MTDSEKTLRGKNSRQRSENRRDNIPSGERRGQGRIADVSSGERKIIRLNRPSGERPQEGRRETLISGESRRNRDGRGGLR